MAHKTLIGGTAYAISGGKTLVGGTAYSIKSGKTLVGGAAYEVGFSNLEVIIDYGVVQGTYESFFKNYIYSANYDGLPEGYDNCTVAVVDGVEYALTPYSISDKTATYTVEGCALLPKPIGINYNATNGYYSMVTLTDGEAHTIALCRSKE